MTTQRNGTNAPTGKDRPTTLVSRGRERTARSSLSPPELLAEGHLC